MFFIKRRVVFHQTTCRFSSNDVLFFIKQRVGGVHRNVTLNELSLYPKLLCATEKSPSNFLHRPRIDVAV